MENQYEERANLFDLSVNEKVKSILLAMAKWTKFLAIVGFVMMAFGVLWAFFFSGKIGELAAMSGNSAYAGQAGGMVKGMLIFFMIIFVAIYFYPTYALLLYSTKIKNSLFAANQEEFENALTYLKNCFQYIGILMIIFIVFYGGFIAMVFAAMATLGR